MGQNEGAQAPLFSLGGFAIAALASLLACWPMWISGSFYVFADTVTYYNAGQEIWQIIARAFQSLLPVSEASSAAGVLATEGGSGAKQSLAYNGEPRFGRSIAYSAFAYPILSGFGPLALAWAQGTLTLLALFALITPQMLKSRLVLLAGLLFVITATQFPWRTVFLMPDIFAATIVVFGAVLIGPFDHLTRTQQVVLTLLACFAVATHYGNIPFAAGLFGLILLWRLVARRWSTAAAIAAFVTVAASPVSNIGASVAVLDDASAVPLRLPIVLARSIQDGPGAQYLRAHCSTEDWAICEAFGDRVPESIRDFLWSDDGIRSLQPEMVQRIRDEEVALLAHVFMAHPVAQSWSFTENAVTQLVRVGQGQITARSDFDAFLKRESTDQVDPETPLKSFDPVVEIGTLLSAIALVALLVSGRCTAAERRVILALALGLVCNAIVFGGLSAPVDRYQARVAWLIPAMLVLIVAAICARGKQRHHTPQGVADVR